MAYGDHDYTREEIHQILCDSERRLRPGVRVEDAHMGHPISQHTEQREDPFDRRHIRRDSTFASRKDMILAIHEVLNSEAGKTELRRLNNVGTDTVRINAPIVEQTGRISANYVHNPTARVRVGRRNRNVEAQGPAFLETGQAVTRVFVMVVRLDPPHEGNKDIHIQTAYPA